MHSCLRACAYARTSGRVRVLHIHWNRELISYKEVRMACSRSSPSWEPSLCVCTPMQVPRCRWRRPTPSSRCPWLTKTRILKRYVAIQLCLARGVDSLWKCSRASCVMSQRPRGSSVQSAKVAIPKNYYRRFDLICDTDIDYCSISTLLDTSYLSECIC